MIKNENYITIQGWMINELTLKGNSLIIYSIIYGFSQTEDCKFTGSANYLAEWCGCSRQTVLTTLNKLVEDKLIIKHEEFRNNVKFCSYSANLTGCKNSLQGDVKKFDRGMSKFFTQ
nr:MAG TPA: helix-turn-helix domain protein [Bacteriophage sp.]